MEHYLNNINDCTETELAAFKQRKMSLKQVLHFAKNATTTKTLL
uniref:Uncharacterized protein n=1 Tax=Anguilla anguilla TaxID=7936 RepID=A0A0E9QHC3_ANGAN